MYQQLAPGMASLGTMKQKPLPSPSKDEEAKVVHQLLVQQLIRQPLPPRTFLPSELQHEKLFKTMTKNVEERNWECE